MDKVEICCKICYSVEDSETEQNELVAPCNCKGSLQYVHRNCLKMWRYKSKYYSVKKCLQCGMYYNIKDEVCPNSIIIFILTSLILFTVHLLISLVLRFSISSTYFFKHEIKIDTFLYGNEPHISFSSINLHMTTFLTYILLFKMVFYSNFLSVFNFIFTYWRIIQLDFFIDKILFFLLCLYYYKQIYDTLYNRLEHFYVLSKEKQL